jgi:hypothetical protein
MHTSTRLRSESFAIEVDGRAATIGEVLPGDAAAGRLGIVVHEPLGAVGASQLLLAAVTAFYDGQRARAETFYIYPDYFLFHVGGRHGDHSMLDVWPAHKEVVVPDEPEAILQAINDRAITWLLVPEGEPGAAPRGREARASARERIASALSYAPAGRVADGDVRIAGNEVTDACVGAVLDPVGAPTSSGGAADSYAGEVARRAGEVGPEARARTRARRRHLCEDGRPLETYRRLKLDAALARLGAGEGAG